MRTCKCAKPKVVKSVRPYRGGAHIGIVTCGKCDCRITHAVVLNRCPERARRLTDKLARMGTHA